MIPAFHEFSLEPKIMKCGDSLYTDLSVILTLLQNSWYTKLTLHPLSMNLQSLDLESHHVLQDAAEPCQSKQLAKLGRVMFQNHPEMSYLALKLFETEYWSLGLEYL